MIVFDPKEHKYTYAGKDPKYKKHPFVSTTTFIGWFKNPFDGDYWSLYKALKDYYMEIGKEEDKWNSVKRKVGGWQNVVDFYRKHEQRVDPRVRMDIRVRQQGYLTEWEHKKKVSTDRGSIIHRELEDDVFVAEKFTDRGNVYKVEQADFFYHKVDPATVHSYPECIIYNLEHMVSGMVDRVDKEGIYLDIVDYKTNIEITKSPFMDQKMKVIDLPDANYYHYQMQMSIYGWMLERFGYKVRSLTLEHLVTPDRYSKRVMDIVPYEMEYRPDLVEKMMDYRFNRKLIK